MKSTSPFPSMASILAEGRARQERATSRCDASREADRPGAIPSDRVQPGHLSQPPRRMGEPRKGGPPQTWEQSVDGDCACKEPVVARPPPQRPTSRRRVASSELLATILGEASPSSKDGMIVLDDEAWSGVQAVQQARADWSQKRRKVERRRARIWPEFVDDAPAGLPAGLWPTPCECEHQYGAPMLRGGPRYVDSELGDDAWSGTWMEPVPGVKDGPWRTLERVQRWIDELIATAGGFCLIDRVQIFLRRGRVWDGATEYGTTSSRWAALLAGEAVLTFAGLKATKVSPIIVGAYGSSGPGQDLPGALRPRLDGVLRDTYGAQYDDQRLGLLFKDTCYVYVSDLAIRGFGRAIKVRGGSKHHIHSGLHLYHNAITGIHITLDKEDANEAMVEDPSLTTVSAQIDYLVSQGRYPEDITVTGCKMWSNGYSTSGADIGLGYLATNCTLSENELIGDDTMEGPRGIDGIVAQASSSGHLIENNRISTHRKWCEAAEFDVTSCPPTSTTPATPVLAQACSSSDATGTFYPTTSTCASGPYGYEIVHTTLSGDSAFGEDGIDLKGVRWRTLTSKRQSVVRGNTIWGHSNFTGIAVADGSQNIHVLRNRVFLNETGIRVSNGNNKGWYLAREQGYYDEKTEDIFIYRNLVYMNLGRGIHIESAYEDAIVVAEDGSESTKKHVYQVAEVYIVNNTVAHNLKAGVHVVNEADGAAVAGDVDGIYLLNNLMIRNGIEAFLPSGSSPGRPSADTAQMAWTGAFDWSLLGSDSSMRFRSDYNAYHGWPDVPIFGDDVIWAYSTTIGVFQAFSGAEATANLGVEANGYQAASMSEFALACELDLPDYEGAFPATPDLVNYLYGVGTVALSSTAVEGLDYDIDLSSVCREEGTSESGAYQPNSSEDIAVSNDLDGEPIGTRPDVGAFETPPASSLEGGVGRIVSFGTPFELGSHRGAL